MELGAKWPVSSGDEITQEHFNDIRKLFWAILQLARAEYDDWDNIPTYRNGLRYNYGSIVKSKGYDGQWRKWKAGSLITGDTPPPHGAWILLARSNVYCDWARNSGTNYDDWAATSPAYMHLPPHVNKYYQQAVTDDDGFNVPKGDAEMPDGTKYGKKQEQPIEFALWSEWFRGDIISGYIGPRYIEMHPYGSGGYAPPWYYPYYLTPSHAFPYSHKYYDIKRGGYQSNIESLAERHDWYWESPEAGGVNDYGEPKPDYVQMSHSDFKCNYSAFEKCLSLIAGESYQQVKATTRYDWFLDTSYTPDPYMYKSHAGSYAYFTKACWRRCWRYTFRPPKTSLMWPGEWGRPPYQDEPLHLWWADWDNVERAIRKARNQIRQRPDEYMKCVNRHWPLLVTRAPEVSNKNPGDDDYLEALNQLLKIRRQSQMSGNMPPPPFAGQEVYYTMTGQMLNDMKDVLDKLRYLRETIDYHWDIKERYNGLFLDDEAYHCENFKKYTWKSHIARLEAGTDEPYWVENVSDVYVGLFASLGGPREDFYNFSGTFEEVMELVLRVEVSEKIINRLEMQQNPIAKVYIGVRGANDRDPQEAQILNGDEYGNFYSDHPNRPVSWVDVTVGDITVPAWEQLWEYDDRLYVYYHYGFVDVNIINWDENREVTVQIPLSYANLYDIPAPAEMPDCEDEDRRGVLLSDARVYTEGVVVWSLDPYRVPLGCDVLSRGGG